MDPESMIDLSPFLQSLNSVGEYNKGFDTLVYRYVNRGKIARRKKEKKIWAATCAIAAVLLGIAIYIEVVIPAKEYRAAVRLYDAGQYSSAMYRFQDFGDYRDSVQYYGKCMDQIYGPNYAAGLEYLQNGQFEAAIKQLRQVSTDYKDTQSLIYSSAVSLMKAGNYSAAVEGYEAILGFRDSSEWITRCKKIQLLSPINDAGVGSIVNFGRYTQDDNKGKQDVAWIVLAKEGNRALLISAYGLEQQPYNQKREKVTWATCTLREWLNDSFYKTAFSSLEQNLIETTSIHTEVYDDWDAVPGPDTEDKIFVLSSDEAEQYFESDDFRKCYPTSHAAKNGFKSKNGCCLWWLRTPGPDNTYVTIVDITGEICYITVKGADISMQLLDGTPGHENVRPAMWVNFNITSELQSIADVR